jgi:hypothetical protein
MKFGEENDPGLDVIHRGLKLSSAGMVVNRFAAAYGRIARW